MLRTALVEWDGADIIFQPGLLASPTARHALPPPTNAQRERDDRPVTSTSTAGALPRSGSSNRSAVKGVGARPSSFLSRIVRMLGTGSSTRSMR
ncbi:MAG: hypothetical protein EPN45_06060 [Rhizobiaceae bacterium]|nr:MAG: hypothetical protein EPN45_06060 [Rhizobiaceae bacterium]